MGKFSVGQMVMCTDDVGSGGDLVCGGAYEVVDRDNVSEGMVNTTTGCWMESRFTLLQQPIKKDLTKENTMKSSTKIPHIHTELIKLWADGAEIEYDAIGCWLDVQGSPLWGVKTSYRVKPEQVYPKTTLSGEELYKFYTSFEDYTEESLIGTINTAIKHFITSGDMDKYIESLK